MPTPKYLLLIREIRQNGFLFMLKVKITEQFYKYKFRKLGVEYPNGQGKIEMVNSQSVNKDSRMNQATNYYALKHSFDFIDITSSNICLLDIGCGHGKAINFGMLRNFKEVTGIDLDPSAIEKATDNCTRMKDKGYETIFSIIETDAYEYLIPESTNVIFMFNPFGKKTMEDVMGNIMRHHYIDNKELFIVYCKPVHQDVLSNYAECIKIYERTNRTNTNSEMAIFKISRN